MCSADLVEHMAFNGTRHFPKMEIVSFMESIGMRFGPSVNAFTSFDETVYQLQIPTDRMEVIDKAMLVLEDWAQHVSAFFPGRYAVEAIQGCVNGPGLGGLRFSLLALRDHLLHELVPPDLHAKRPPLAGVRDARIAACPDQG